MSISTKYTTLCTHKLPGKSYATKISIIKSTTNNHQCPKFELLIKLTKIVKEIEKKNIGKYTLARYKDY